MQRAHLAGFAGQGYVDGLFLQASLLFGVGDARRLLVQGGLYLFTHAVDQLAHGGALLGRELAHAAQQAGQFALFAQYAHAQRFQLLRGLEFFLSVKRFLQYLLQLFAHFTIILSVYN